MLAHMEFQPGCVQRVHPALVTHQHSRRLMFCPWTDHRANQVRFYKLTPGKVEGAQPHRDKLMEGLVDGMHNMVKDIDADDQWVRRLAG